jgi:hypothetical protein
MVPYNPYHGICRHNKRSSGANNNNGSSSITITHSLTNQPYIYLSISCLFSCLTLYPLLLSLPPVSFCLSSTCSITITHSLTHSPTLYIYLSISCVFLFYCLTLYPLLLSLIPVSFCLSSTFNTMCVFSRLSMFCLSSFLFLSLYL